MNQNEKLMLDAVDIIGQLRRECVKANFISWEIESEFFNMLTLAVERDDREKVLLMCKTDVYCAEAKAEIVGNIIGRMMEIIDAFQAKFERAHKAQREAQNGGGQE